MFCDLLTISRCTEICEFVFSEKYMCCLRKATNIDLNEDGTESDGPVATTMIIMITMLKIMINNGGC